MATAPKGTPLYADQLVAWHNQRLWWLLVGAGAAIVALTVALCIVVLQPHGSPYVIEVNSKGEPEGMMQPFQYDITPVADSTMRWFLGQFIAQAFSVTTFEMNQINLKHVYAESTGQASDALTAYYRADHDANNPLFVNDKWWQDVRITRTLKLPAKDTYEVDYTLNRHPRWHDTEGTQSNWRATMKIVQGKPTVGNTLGVWLTNLYFEPEAKS